MALAQEAHEQEEGAHAEHGSQGEGAHLQPAGREAGAGSGACRRGGPSLVGEPGCALLSWQEAPPRAGAGAAAWLAA